MHILSGLLTGHVALKNYLTVIKICMCPKRDKEEETAYHFLGKYNAMMMARYSILGSYLMEINDLQQLQPHIARASERST